jgi:hypothetical protein
MREPRIIVSSRRDFESHRRLLTAVGQLWGVLFEPSEQRSAEKPAAALVFDQADAMRFQEAGVRTVLYPRDGSRQAMAPSAVRFGTTTALSASFNGATLTDRAAAHVPGFLRDAVNRDRCSDGVDVVLASVDGEALWTRRQVADRTTDRVALLLPKLESGQHLFEVFGAERWLAVLPLMHVAQEVSGWMPPKSRACFMFDDPNLHWPTYGYVRYQELAIAAERDNYHVSFATVPMDAWYVHPPTAALFRKYSARLSLLVHGNNHTRMELHSGKSPSDRQALAAQAIRRIEALERRSGVKVSRVMAAPHGACSAPMAADLRRMGFNAACISRGSLMSRNPEHDWPLTVGLQAAEFFGGGLPILPRHGFAATTNLQVRLSTFLGQPIVPMGHHEDLRGGLGPLSQAAHIINSVLPTTWADMDALAASNFFTRRIGHSLQVRMYTRRMAVSLPASVTELQVERPWMSSGETEPLLAGRATSIDSELTIDGERWVTIPNVSSDCVTLTSRAVDAEDPRTKNVVRPPMRAILRRQFCELRDRVRPIIAPALDGGRGRSTATS